MAKPTTRAAGAADLHRVKLPGGYVDRRGRPHTEVALAPLTGAAEHALAGRAAGASVAALTTLVLAHAIVSIDGVARVTPEIVRALLVQDRDYLLAQLRILTLGPRMWARLGCPSCGQDMELQLMLDELPVTPRLARTLYMELDGELEMRLPNGADQEWAAESGLIDAPELGFALLARCLRPVRGRRTMLPRLDGKRADHIEERMRALAPDVTPELDAVCPHCEAAFSAEIDVPYLVLAEITASARRIEEDVHLLAWNYHWAERDILLMSRTKRDRYLRLVRAQLEANGAVAA